MFDIQLKTQYNEGMKRLNKTQEVHPTYVIIEAFEVSLKYGRNKSLESTNYHKTFPALFSDNQWVAYFYGQELMRYLYEDVKPKVDDIALEAAVEPETYFISAFLTEDKKLAVLRYRPDDFLIEEEDENLKDVKMTIYFEEFYCLESIENAGLVLHAVEEVTRGTDTFFLANELLPIVVSETGGSLC